MHVSTSADTSRGIYYPDSAHSTYLPVLAIELISYLYLLSIATVADFVT